MVATKIINKRYCCTFFHREISLILKLTMVAGIWHVGVFTRIGEWVSCKPLTDPGMKIDVFLLFSGNEEAETYAIIANGAVSES